MGVVMLVRGSLHSSGDISTTLRYTEASFNLSDCHASGAHALAQSHQIRKSCASPAHHHAAHAAHITSRKVDLISLLSVPIPTIIIRKCMQDEGEGEQGGEVMMAERKMICTM